MLAGALERRAPLSRWDLHVRNICTRGYMMSIANAARWRDKMQISQFRFDATLMARVGFGSALAVMSGR